MTWRAARAAAVLLLAALVAACAVVTPMPLVPSLFPPMAAAPTRDASAVVLVLDAPGQTFRSPPLRHFAARVDLPLGQIVEAAGLLAFGRQFETASAGAGAGAVAGAGAGAGAGAPAGAALRLQVAGVAMDLQSELIYFIPLPYLWPTRVDLTARLAFTLRLVGPDGAVRWTQNYDSGRVLWEPRRAALIVLEPVPDGIQRLAHELSAQLMHQAAGDLRRWLAQERQRERVL